MWSVGRVARFLLLGLAAASQAASANVIGLPNAEPNVFVAIRGLVPEGSRVVGIRFISNDATLFPMVSLAREAPQAAGLPSPGTLLRAVTNVLGVHGVVTASFPPYQLSEDEVLWAVVRFPDNQPLHNDGIGGGPGIGWRGQTILAEERSLFSVNGSMNEFTPAFDLEFVFTGPDVGKAIAPAEPTGAHPLTFEARTTIQPLAQVSFQIAVPRDGRLVLDVYDVAGRRVIRLVDQVVSAGQYAYAWRGDTNGRSASSGVYAFAARFDNNVKSGKILLLR